MKLRLSITRAVVGTGVGRKWRGVVVCSSKVGKLPRRP